MIHIPVDVVAQYPVRKSGKQKEVFRQDVISYCESLGYSVSVEKGSCKSRNVVIGDPTKAKYLVTAHYDTCARLPFPNLITPCNLVIYLLYQFALVFGMLAISMGVGIVTGYLTDSFVLAELVYMVLLLGMCAMMMVGPANPSNVNDNTSGVVTVLEIAKSLPENLRDKVCFVLFDLEEAGLIGSASYQKKHKKETQNQIVLNLDCVGEGDEILLFPTGKLKKDQERIEKLNPITGNFETKSIALRTKGTAIYPSDQAHFPYGVGICALKRGKVGLYLSRIHTPKDTILDEENVNILRAAIICCIAGTAVE